MKKHFLTILLLGSFLLNAKAQVQQEQPKQRFWDRVYFGGNFGLSFGTNASEVEISPLAGYKITERLSAGLGVTYIYFRFKDPYYGYTYKTSIYGGDIFARYFFFENIFGHVETGALNLDAQNQFYPYDLSRQWVQNFLVGGGYRSQVGERSSFFIMLLYDLIDDPNSPYQNPIFRMGLGIGI